MMKRPVTAGLAAFAVLASGPAFAQAYSATAEVTFEWATDGVTRGWTSSGANTLPNLTNATYISQEAGSNSTTYYNSDFADQAFFDGLACPAAFIAQYACKTATPGTSPIADAGPGASASGTITVTDTTLTGTLTVSNTNDEGAGLQTGTTAATGYNVRSADGSPFKNVWYGVSNAATLELDLSGTFTASTWEITGGTVTLNDASFQCAVADFSGVLCTPSTTGGGFQPDGGFLSWGMDQGTGAATDVTPIQVFDATGTTLVETLAGVLASLAVAPDGTITTTTGEVRTAGGSGSGGCPTSIRWDGAAISCGTLIVGLLDVTGLVIDDVPDAFAFTDQTDVALATQVTSDTVTITGINTDVPVSVTGGEYSVNGGAFTAAAGTVSDGDTVAVRQTSSASPSTTTDVVLDVGGVTDTFSVTTEAADTTPDAFSFDDQVDVAFSTVIQSNAVTIAGINQPAAIAVTGGEYSVNGGAYTAAAGTVNDGDTVRVRHTSAAVSLTDTDTTLTVGGVADTFTSTTADTPPDTSPDPFAFADRTDAPRAEEIVSDPVTITGINTDVPITVTGGQYSINGGAFTSAAGTVGEGDQVRVRHVSSTVFNATISTTLTVGSGPAVSDVFQSSTRRVSPGGSSVDGLMLGLLGLLAVAGGRRRR